MGLDTLLGDGLVYTHSTGLFDNRAEYIAKCKKGVFHRKIERPTENIHIYGDTAVVTGHTKMEVMVDGKAKLLNSRYTKGPKGWQMVVWQSTPVPA